MIMDSRYKICYIEQEGKVYSNLRNFLMSVYLSALIFLCHNEENVNLCIHSPIHLHGVVLN
jgi:hypothetical protein